MLHAVNKGRSANQLVNRVPISFARSIGRSERAAQLIWHGLAESTRSGGEALRESFTSFVFCSFGHVLVFPAQEEWLVEWVADQDGRNRRFHAIKRDLYLLKLWHVDFGASTSGFGGQLERTLRGLKHLRGVSAAKAKLPITLPLLRAIITQLPSVCTPRNTLVFHAAFALAFACFLRSGELTYTVFDPSRHLAVQSVVFAANGRYAVVTLPASKTDPFRQGVQVVAPAVDGVECPVRALLALTHASAPQFPLLQLEDSQPFTRTTFLATLKSCLQAAGVDASGFSGHLFRRGAATWAASLGCSEDDIRTMGRWNSSCARRYVDRSAEDRGNLVRQLYSTCTGPLLPTSSTWRSF
jgi:hypothetical protein